jgi:hypothetical protein
MNTASQQTVAEFVGGWKRRSLALWLLTSLTIASILLSSGASRSSAGELLLIAWVAIAAFDLIYSRRQLAVVSKGTMADALALNARELVRLRVASWLSYVGAIALTSHLRWAPLTGVEVGLIFAFVAAGLFLHFVLLPAAKLEGDRLRNTIPR